MVDVVITQQILPSALGGDIDLRREDRVLLDILQPPAEAGYISRTVFAQECVHRFEVLSKDRSKRWLQKFEQLHFEEWNDEYWADVCDGEQWSLVYQYAGEEKKRCWGSNAYPENWDSLIELVDKLKNKLPIVESDVDDYIDFLRVTGKEEEKLERCVHRR